MAVKNNPLAADELSADEEKLLREVEDAPPVEQADAPAESPSEAAAEDVPVADANTAVESTAPAEPAEQQRTVPLPALLEERKERQRAEKEFAEYKGRTEATLRAIQERLAKPQAQEDVKSPTLETDPVGVLRETQQQVQAIQQRQAAEQQLNQFSGYVANQVQDFRAQTPDYDAALNHARNARLGELKIMGLSDQQARQQLALDEFAFAQAAIQSGRNVGEATYQYALHRGYQKPQAAPAAQATPSPAQKLETVAKGQQAAKSLGGASGGVGTAPLTIEKLIEMTPDQIGNLDEEQFRRLMGG